MGYLHIDNLYKNQEILLFRECYALEKIHGTSAHIQWSEGKVIFFSGGSSHEQLSSLFDKEKLASAFQSMGVEKITVFGEAYGGKLQGMKETYGPNLKFVVFDVRIGESWLVVPAAEKVAKDLGLEFVHYERVSTDEASLNAQRDADSIQAVRNGMGPGKMREGVVLRPLIEVTKNNGQRIIAKHKREEFSETATKRSIKGDPVVLEEASAIALEWVTPMRLTHVLDKLEGEAGRKFSIEDTVSVLDAMVENVSREAKGEILETKEAQKAIRAATAKLFKRKLKEETFKEQK